MSSTGAGSSTDRNERVASALVGLTLIGASAPTAWTSATGSTQFSAALGVVVGLLFVSRSPVREHGTNGQIAAALPSLAAGSLVLRMLADTSPAPWMIGVSAGGAVLALTAVASLGRSFSILPAKRELVTRGPYRWVRHPAYLGQWIIVAGCAPALDPSWWGVALALGLLPWLALRMLAEERLLAEDAAFAAYFQRVRWRMVPGVW